ncbi:MAG: amidophosphoribosyltransferase [Eubacteriales bacterium]|nr:amidophosphoribosyltransferase [Eubacteriales bacterium]
MGKNDFYKIGEECGVFGICAKGSEPCAWDVYHGLVALQHRGQESCGIAATDGAVINYYKDMGTVGEVFGERRLESIRGNMAIGHVRYSTTGESRSENAQPLVINHIKGSFALCHNGNLVNTSALRDELQEKGAIFRTTTDSEVIAYLIAKERIKISSVEDAVLNVMKIIKGAYSLLIMSADKLIAVRDPFGMRPLCIGKRGEDFVFASESCALTAVGAEFVRDVLPGEIVTVENNRLKSVKFETNEKSSLCIFELIYFARPDSIIDGSSVYEARKQAGRILAREHKVDADLVIGVPDSGIDAAIGYSEESKIPYGIGLVKNRYIGRTFIYPTQEQRERGVEIKLSAIESSVQGKRIVMIDDSIVRGTTSSKIVTMLRRAGAKQVHMRVSSPPFVWPCYFGTDIPSKEALAACRYTIEEIRQSIGANSLGYLSLEGLSKIAPNSKCGFCDACFSGNYPMEIN